MIKAEGKEERLRQGSVVRSKEQNWNYGLIAVSTIWS